MWTALKAELRIVPGATLGHCLDVEDRRLGDLGLECRDGGLDDPAPILHLVGHVEFRIPEGMGNGLALDDPEYAHGLGQRNQRRDQRRRNTLVLDRLGERRPATRTRPSGRAHDHGLHPVGDQGASHLGADAGHVAQGAHIARRAQ